MFRNENALPPIELDQKFDLIVVGTGNGACGFLGECLKHIPRDSDYQILVLELGTNFFYTSDITHQNGWSKTYSSGSIFKLHDAVTPDGRSVLAGRANTMGGGGSINYTMIHESSDWLAEQAGRDPGYWDTCKCELNKSLDRPNPFKRGYQTPFAEYISSNAQNPENFDTNEGFSAPNCERDMIENIPSYFEDKEKPLKQMYIFPTQFNQFGSRTNSGVSLVEWERITYRWNTEVTGLVMSQSDKSYTCTGVKTKNVKTFESTTYKVKEGTGRVVLCGGSQSPRLLLKAKELADMNEKIGQRVNDHICMPLGIYMVKKEKVEVVGPTDNYQSLFAIDDIPCKIKNGDNERSENVPVNIDFFSGEVLRLIYLISSLYLCYLPLNGFKKFMGRRPIVFTYLSNTIRILLTGLVYVINFVCPCVQSFVITTSLVKFSAVTEGYYERKGDKIVLRFFDNQADYDIAEEAINKNLQFLESNGEKPNFLIRSIFQFITKIPYRRGREVKCYVRNFARKTLLSEQHLAGGCLFGDVIDKGSKDDPASTGRVFNTTNLHVADLSAVPLPRVSTQMTAYLIGHHVAKQLYGTVKK